MKKKARKLAKRNPEARELLRNPLFRPKTTKSADAAVAQALCGAVADVEGHSLGSERHFDCEVLDDGIYGWPRS